jgi:hypothetical protein
MMQTDLTLAKIVRAIQKIRRPAKSRRLHDRRPPHRESERASAPIADTDRCKLEQGCRTTFPVRGTLRPMLKSLQDIAESDPIFRACDAYDPSQKWPKSSPVVLFKIKPESAACIEFESDAPRTIEKIQAGAQRTQ